MKHALRNLWHILFTLLGALGLAFIAVELINYALGDIAWHEPGRLILYAGVITWLTAVNWYLNQLTAFLAVHHTEAVTEPGDEGKGAP